MVAKETKTLLDIFLQLTALIFTIIPVYIILKSSPQDVTTPILVIFGTILGVFILGIIFNFIYSRYKKAITDINENEQNLKLLRDEMHQIRKDLNFERMHNSLDVRLRVIETLLDDRNKGNKKGQLGMDPRLVIWIILLILLILFLKQAGIL